MGPSDRAPGGVGIDTHLGSILVLPLSPRRPQSQSFPAFRCSIPQLPLPFSQPSCCRPLFLMFGLSLVVTLLLSVPAFTQVVTNANLLPGTWSTGSGAVTTGPVRSFGAPSVEPALTGPLGLLHPREYLI